MSWIVWLFLPRVSGYYAHEGAVELPLLRRTPPPTTLPSLRGVQDNTLALTNRLGTQYLVPIRLNDDIFHVQVDTGSADLWVGCEFVDSPSHCSPPVGACSNASSTELVYGSGRVCLDAHRGAFQLGSLAIPQVSYSIGKSALLTDGSQGILGLAFSRISPFVNHSNASFPMHHLDSFSLTLSSGVNSAGSKLILNGVDHSRIASHGLIGVTLPLIEAAHWTVSMDDMVVDGQPWSVCGALWPCKAIVDSGTTFLSMPPIVFDQFAATYLAPHGCTMAPSDAYFVCPHTAMKHLPTLRLVLHRHPFSLQRSDYTWQLSPKSFLVQLQPSAVAHTWVLGDTFLKVYPITFHVRARALTIYCAHGRCRGGPAVPWEVDQLPQIGESNVLGTTSSTSHPS
ncbi:hypothetical protein DYB37_004390 [Aphanomyces astaci]|uniref:Peptidase A1 domain-containing protein n=1 Tax=Aphanomyces astaci TaxID=112090 RepID=A0A3R7A0C5_APHAT|nr:hypothetical protein DYB35_012060 [Aphanomyces astaci]RHZ07116.1 hypothetical protein DYB37_004390 [Aphanomyces astaci]